MLPVLCAEFRGGLRAITLHCVSPDRPQHDTLSTAGVRIHARTALLMIGVRIYAWAPLLMAGVQIYAWTSLLMAGVRI